MEPRIGIVGAGMAGITAAKELVDMGHRVHLLEAKPHIGGRISTHYQGSTAIDLGASIVWGGQPSDSETQAKNPLAALLKYLPDTQLAAINFLKNSPFFDKQGHNIQAAILAGLQRPAFRARMENFIQRHQKIFFAQKARDPNNERPLPCLADCLKGPENASGSPEEALFEQIINISFLHQYGIGAKHISLWNLYIQNAYPGEHCLAAGAFSTLMAHMLRSIESRENFSLSLNTPVTVIEKKAAETISLRTASGEVLYFNRVLVTVPLGVLKANALSFYPGLSTEKQQAIAALRVGHCNKVVLRFQKSFWPETAESLLIVNEKNQVYEYLNVDHFSKSKTATLVVTLYGMAADFSDKSDDLIKKRLLSPLQSLYPNHAPLLDIFVTRWESDPFAQGALTALGRHATPQTLQDMAAPEWDQQLFFAGEHSDVDYGMVQGAYASGLRASQSIDNSLHLRKRPEKQP